MSDYNKQTVANLRQLLKDRGIPSTGLTRKAQIIEKLEEWDKRGEEEAGAAEVEAEPETAPAIVAVVEEEKDDRDPDAQRDQVMVNPEVVLEPVREPAREGEAAPIEVNIVEPNAVATEAPIGTGAPETESEPAPELAPDAPEAIPVSDVSEPAAIDPISTRTTDAEPAPAIATTDFATDNRDPSAGEDEKPSIERAESVLQPEHLATSTADQSRLNTEELEADSRKRKRRSLSPSLPSQDVRAKKPRPNDEAAPEVHLKEDGDTDIVMEQRAPEDEGMETNEQTKDEATNDTRKSESAPEVAPAQAKSPTPEPERRPGTGKKDKAPRYRELFEPVADRAPEEAITDDRPIVPALHAATPAIYIRNLMRPLRPDPLRAHLVSLASPPSSSPDVSIVKHLFIDNMKTHALVLLASTTAASRVRASLHGSIWPPEANRKELWVDFIPEDKVEEWIKEEEDAIAAEKEARGPGRPPAKKFEVVYPTDDDGAVTAVFQEVGASGPAWNPPRGPRRPSQQIGAPTPPHAMPKPAAPTQETRQDVEKSFKTLKELFLSTAAKPELYYLPVSDERSDLRLKELDAETSRNWTPEATRKGRGMQGSRLDQKVRFGFDEDDRVIEVGPDFGPWADDSVRGAGGRGGGGFRGRGGWRGGGRGGEFRGGYRGGGGWRSGN